MPKARSASPGTVGKPPTISVTGRGRDNTKKSAAQANPSGTRQRCIHVPPLRNRHKFGSCNPILVTQPIHYRVPHALGIDVHTDPLRPAPAMTPPATTNHVPVDADV